jgi:hypothetical protein
MIHRASQFCRNPANNLAGHRLGLKPELRARKNVVMQQGRMTRNMMTLARESTEDRFKHGKREPRRDSSSSVTATVPSQPLRLPFLNDGLEAVRDSYCWFSLFDRAACPNRAARRFYPVDPAASPIARASVIVDFFFKIIPMTDRASITIKIDWSDQFVLHSLRDRAFR